MSDDTKPYNFRTSRNWDHDLDDNWHFVALSFTQNGTAEYIDNLYFPGQGEPKYKNKKLTLSAEEISRITFLSHRNRDKQTGTLADAFVDDVRVYNRSLSHGEVPTTILTIALALDQLTY